LLRELLRYHNWATLTLIDRCQQYPQMALQEKVTGTDRSILHTLTHILGTEEGFVEALTGVSIADRIHAGEVLSLVDLRRHCEKLSSGWEAPLNSVAQLDVTLPAEEAQRSNNVSPIRLARKKVAGDWRVIL
jgi:uncharacterized damage-inducible protein DinB